MRYSKLETCYVIEMGLQQGSLQKHHLDYLLNTISLITVYCGTSNMYEIYVEYYIRQL